MKHLKHIGCLLLVALLSVMPAVASGAEAGEKSTVDVKEIVLGHMGDAYEWHILTWNGHEVAIPLPVIVKGENPDGIASVLPVWQKESPTKVSTSTRPKTGKYMKSSTTVRKCVRLICPSRKTCCRFGLSPC